ncbi:hypothetical protein FJT64_025256 [Amphibalanus amphitrite]|uniref:Uncharacterized protein n=1 Tax=Amphibalanus amphitrite TaxID=1232801 RepID=A0A6A4WFP8_AMPAM|nr:hypothetical protein FJT64_025256 [Amphibalanus amphitrite]
MNKACSVITKGSEKQWVPHRPDLNPLDYWFWGACKDSDSVYHNKPGSLEELRLSVEQYVREVTADTAERSLADTEQQVARVVSQANQGFIQSARDVASIAPTLSVPPPDLDFTHPREEDFWNMSPRQAQMTSPGGGDVTRRLVTSEATQTEGDPLLETDDTWSRLLEAVASGTHDEAADGSPALRSQYTDTLRSQYRDTLRSQYMDTLRSQYRDTLRRGYLPPSSPSKSDPGWCRGEDNNSGREDNDSGRSSPNPLDDELEICLKSVEEAMASLQNSVQKSTARPETSSATPRPELNRSFEVSPAGGGSSGDWRRRSCDGAELETFGRIRSWDRAEERDGAEGAQGAQLRHLLWPNYGYGPEFDRQNTRPQISLAPQPDLCRISRAVPEPYFSHSKPEQRRGSRTWP